MPGSDGGDSSFGDLTAAGGSGGRKMLFRADDLNSTEAVVVGGRPHRED